MKVLVRDQGIASVIGGLILAPIVFLVYSILIRVWLEGFIATIRTAENTRIIAERLRQTDL